MIRAKEKKFEHLIRQIEQFAPAIGADVADDDLARARLDEERAGSAAEHALGLVLILRLRLRNLDRRLLGASRPRGGGPRRGEAHRPSHHPAPREFAWSPSHFDPLART